VRRQVHHAARHPDQQPQGQQPAQEAAVPGSHHPDDSVQFLSWLLAISKVFDEAMAVARTVVVAGVGSGRNSLRDWLK
jgi:hypothetical protein